ncbi:MAG: UPF0236 family protein, partial [Mycoplasmataceae bacterium]|nr:UPF0236 family protein [Mycoplasmataceae bacterium]
HKTVDKSKWHVKDRRSRRLWTMLGDIKITRRIYESNRKNFTKRKQAILFDEYLGLKPWIYIQECFYMMFVSNIGNVTSYKSLASIFQESFSSSMISKISKKIKLYLQPKKLRESTDILFLNVDDIFVKQHRKDKYPMRMAVAYTGSVETGSRTKNGKKYNNNTKKRYKLKEKTLIMVNNELSIPKQAEQIETQLLSIYGSIKKIILVGDGANWISNYKNYFSIVTVERFIDQFHYTKYVKDFVGKNNPVNWDYFVSLSKKRAIAYLLSLVADKDGVVNKDAPRFKYFAKIKKFFNSFVKARNNFYPNCIEGIQSHYVASFLKGRRHFSKEVAINIMTMNIAKFNGWNLSSDKENSYSILELGISKNDIYLGREELFSNAAGLDSANVSLVSFLNALI